MSPRHGLVAFLLSGLAAFLATHATTCSALAQEVRKPNIVFILADDLGYGDMGCYGGKLIRTLNLDRMAQEGMRFTDCYADSTVCSPSRCVLMTGRHTGHARIRANMAEQGGRLGWKAGPKGNKLVRRMHLTDEDVTVAQVLQKAGYHTCLVGKWHLEGYEPTAVPHRRGFDEVYCKLMHDSGTEEAIDFIKRNADRPFFLYLANISPHGPYQIPDVGSYAETDWTDWQKKYAAMITHLDACVGRVLQALKQAGIDRQTVVFFCSDNGPPKVGRSKEIRVAKFFDSTGPLTGFKRDLNEGGIRVPAIVRWPDNVPAGQTSDAVWYFTDFLPTATELAGVEPPADIDGVSVLPTLLGRKQETPNNRFLYWEIYDRGFRQAVRWRNWKSLRFGLDKPLKLCDLTHDASESHDVAAQHPDVVQRIDAYLKTARTESENWPIRAKRERH